MELEEFAKILPALVTVSRFDGPADVVPVDFSCDQFLLGDGNSGDDDDCEGNGVDCGVNGVDQSEGQEAGKSGECAELHDGGWVKLSWRKRDEKNVFSLIWCLTFHNTSVYNFHGLTNVLSKR